MNKRAKGYIYTYNGTHFVTGEALYRVSLEFFAYAVLDETLLDKCTVNFA